MSLPRFFIAIAFILLSNFMLCADPAESPVPLKLEASRAGNTGSHSPNSLGVYPVRLRWQKPAVQDEIRGYHVYRSTKEDSGFERISPEPVEKESGGFFTFIDNNPSAVPGKIFYYRVSLLDSGGGASRFSETVAGYGALSHERYMREYNKTIKSSHQKLTYMNKPGTTSKLGSEQKEGSISGSISYQARIAGLGGRVIIQYDRYADFYIDNTSALGPCFVLTGNMNTSASMNQSGTMDGTVHISGMYPGRVYYDKVQIKNGMAGGGTYGVEPDGFPRAELSWTVGEN